MRATLFTVTKESYGWSVRLGGMMSSFGSRELALLHANSCAARLRGYGEEADVVAAPGSHA